MATALVTGCSSDKKNGGDSASATTVGGGATTTTLGRQITGGPFCEFALTFGDRFGRVGAGSADPAQFRTNFEEATQAIEGAEAIAPPEVKADVSTLATGFRDLQQILRQANYDFTKVPPASFQRLQTPELQAAGQRLDAYVRQNCRAS